MVPWLLTISFLLSVSLLAALYVWLQRRRAEAREPDRRATAEVLSEDEEERQALRRLAERRGQRPE